MEFVVDVAAVTAVVKVLVDLFQLAWPERPSSAPPIMALATGVAVAFLMVVAGGQAVTEAVAAQAVLVGVLAAGGAVGVTELQEVRKALRRRS